MWAHPGKKLLFMGSELAQYQEWSEERSLDWHLLEFEPHAGVQRLVAALNRLQIDQPALWQRDYTQEGFRWLDASDRAASVLAFNRLGDDGSLVACVANLTPVPREGYRLGVVDEGPWQELLSTDDLRFGGTGVVNPVLTADDTPWQGQPCSLVMTLPPLGVSFIGRRPR
jgi:1,4-alpha-glucan branching enzyme